MRHRALIHPDTVLGTPQLPFPTAGTEDELLVLDRAQEAIAKTLGAGHRVIRGVAGSGKTLVLTYRARLLAGAFPDQRVLVTCFNRSLAGSLRRQLPLDNVRVATIDQLLNDVRRRAGAPSLEFKDTDLAARAEATLTAIESAGPVLDRFDHVLVDEGQDFPTAALRFVTMMLADGSDSLLIVADAAQNIYRNKFTWKAAGIQAGGRTKALDQSYRNTREIQTYAHAFLLGGGDLTAGHETTDDDESVIIVPRTSVRSGPFPLFLHLGSPQLELLEIARRCRNLIDNGTSPGLIAILYGSQWAGGFAWPVELVRLFRSENLPLFWVTDAAQPGNRDQLGADPSRITLSTIHSAKGFEFRHVFLCGYLEDRPPEQSHLNRRLIYVGMTRASDELILTASGDHPYIADLDT